MIKVELMIKPYAQGLSNAAYEKLKATVLQVIADEDKRRGLK